MTYKLTLSNVIRRLTDGACIPTDPANRDYAEYLEWLSKGNTPEAADPEPVFVDWIGFFKQIRKTSVYDKIRNTEFRQTLTEIITGTAEAADVQAAFNLIKASMTQNQLNAAQQLFNTYNLPLTIS